MPLSRTTHGPSATSHPIAAIANQTYGSRVRSATTRTLADEEVPAVLAQIFGLPVLDFGSQLLPLGGGTV